MINYFRKKCFLVNMRKRLCHAIKPGELVAITCRLISGVAAERVTKCLRLSATQATNYLENILKDVKFYVKGQQPSMKSSLLICVYKLCINVSFVVAATGLNRY